MDGDNNMIIVGLVRNYKTGKEMPMSWTKKGQYNPSAGDSFYDIFFKEDKKPIKRKG